MLTSEEKHWLNTYHQEVYDKLSPYLSEEEKGWLKKETRAV
jgi:Xaa-Pro aminopeptidase